MKAKHSEETEEQNSVLRRKVNVRIEKLDYSEYLRTQNKVKSIESALSKTTQVDTESVFVDNVPTLPLAETEVKQENVTTDDPLEISVKKEESDCWDLESKMEIVKDIFFKAESADSSVFIQEMNDESSTVEDKMNVAEIKKEETNEEDHLLTF